MATASASLVPVAATGTAMISSTKTQKRPNKVVYIRGMNEYQGLKAHNSLVSLGSQLTSDQAFANMVRSLRAPIHGRGMSTGGLAAKCNAVAEIFKIAAVMNGLVLVGVAVGFVLLRIEAFVEESEE